MLTVCAVISFVAKHVFTNPSYIDESRRIENARIVSVLDSGKSLSCWLAEFRTRYGGYPDVETAKRFVSEAGGGLGLSGDTANDYLRQLIASGIAKSEKPFHVRTPSSNEEPDDNMSGYEALRPGEVGYGYIMNGNHAINPDNQERVILVAPLLNGGKPDEFDKNALFGKAVLVCCNGSVLILRISADNKVRLQGGEELMDTGEGTMWGSEIKPVIKLPIVK